MNSSCSRQWSSAVCALRTRPIATLRQSRFQHSISRFERRKASSATQHADEFDVDAQAAPESTTSPLRPANEPWIQRNLRKYPSPPPSRASKSTRLAAFHARLALPPRLPMEVLARCLVHPSADSHPQFNNLSFSILGGDLLEYFTAEAILSRFPRLPSAIMLAAMSGYVGPRALSAIRRDWGIESATYPGGEVDPGLLQAAWPMPDDSMLQNTGIRLGDLPNRDTITSATRPQPHPDSRRTIDRSMNSRLMYDDSFGEVIPSTESLKQSTTAPNSTQPDSSIPSPTTSTETEASTEVEEPSTTAVTYPAPSQGYNTLEHASASFIRAVFGALYMHTGLRQTKSFYNAHILSRHLDIASLFAFRTPKRDLAKLCAREGFEPPVARILAETGRASRHPVFVVGIFSGREQLGEGSGGSLNEARTRAAIGALKGWYLYSPLKVRVPSETVGRGDGAGETWEPIMVDGGEVIV